MTRRLNLVFMGTPEFAATILGGLIQAGYAIRAVFTQPPRPARRGHRLRPSPVQLLAEQHGLPVRCPPNLRDPATQAEFAAHGADAAVVAAYGLILPSAILAAPLLGGINVHASLLPRWRGAAPIQRAILAGDAETGVTIMQMDEGLDTGLMVLQRAIGIGPDTTAATLTGQLAALGAGLVVEALDGLARGTLTPILQPAAGITYAKKIGRDEVWLDWRDGAAALERRVRALDGADFLHRGERIRVLAATVLAEPPGAAPGTVLDERLSIACGEGVLRPLRLQRPGRTAQDAPAFLRGFAIPQGTVLACPATG
jgi:methionyl-tRNA formyltransferase